MADRLLRSKKREEHGTITKITEAEEAIMIGVAVEAEVDTIPQASKELTTR